MARSNAFSRLASDTVIPEYFAFQAETRALGHPVLATEIGTICAGLMLLQDPDDLLFGPNCSLHCPSLPWGGLQSLVEEKSRGRSLLDRIAEASNASVVHAYEARIDKLERQKIVLQERLDKAIPPKGHLEDCIDLALGFLAKPWNLYKNGDYAMRQKVLRLAFAEPLRYSQKGVYGTPEFSFPFKFLGGFSGLKSEMVLQERIELSTSPLPRECSTTELLQRRRWPGD